MEVGIGGGTDATAALNDFAFKQKNVVIGKIEKEHCNALGNTLY